MGFPEQLKRARRSRNYTQQQIADLMGITKSTYCGYETGKRKPDIEKIQLLVKLLQISGDALLETGFCPEADENANAHGLETGEGNPFDGDPESGNTLREALSVLQSLRPEFQSFALDFLRKLAELQEEN